MNRHELTRSEYAAEEAAQELITISFPRADGDITCALDRDTLALVEAVDENGSDVDLSPAEINELVRRAKAGEDETGW